MQPPDQQAAVAAALDRQRSRRCNPLSISHSAAAMKSSKTFCLRLEHAGPVPGLAVLAAAAEVGDGVDAARYQASAALR